SAAYRLPVAGRAGYIGYLRWYRGGCRHAWRSASPPDTSLSSTASSEAEGSSSSAGATFSRLSQIPSSIATYCAPALILAGSLTGAVRITWLTTDSTSFTFLYQGVLPAAGAAALLFFTFMILVFKGFNKNQFPYGPGQAKNHAASLNRKNSLRSDSFWFL